MGVTAFRKLAELAEKCEATCDTLGRDNFGLSPIGTPNYRLAYSHPSTFRAGADFMLLGINPGGCPVFADRHDRWEPFSTLGHSAYLHEIWGASPPKTPADKLECVCGRSFEGKSNTEKHEALDRHCYEAEHNHGLVGGKPCGEYPLQRGAFRVAEAFAGDAKAAKSLLRNSPTGNMIPFRSPAIKPESREWNDGVPIGIELVKIVRPRVLVLLGGGEKIFKRLLEGAYVGRATDCCMKQYVNEQGKSNRQTYRDATILTPSGRPQYLFVLPRRSLQLATRDFASRLRQLGVQETS